MSPVHQQPSGVDTGPPTDKLLWTMVEGLEPEAVDKSREEWLEVADRVRAMLTDEPDQP
jgi:hypothetical protein